MPWHFTKRQRYVVIATALTAGLALALQWALGGWSLPIFLALVYLATLWALEWDLRHEEWVVLPLYALLLAGIFYSYLLSFSNTTWLLWGGIIAFGPAMYGTLLTLNVLNIATVRPIPLARPATSVLSMIGFCCAFGLGYLALMSRWQFGLWIAQVGAISWLVAWPLLWVSIEKGKVLKSVAWSGLISLVAMQLAAILIFWPANFFASVLLAAGIYMAAGLAHHVLRRQSTTALQVQYWAIGAVLIFILLLLRE